MTITLERAEELTGITVLEHLERDAELPAMDNAACQGDVSILRDRNGITAATTPIPQQGLPVVKGENGGNTHSLHGADCFFDFVQGGGSVTQLKIGTLTVPEGREAYLLHPEHGGMAILPGTYSIGRQREYAGEWRQVAD